MSRPVVTGRPVAPGRQRWTLPPARYRHPGDVIRLVIAGLVLTIAGAATYATDGTYTVTFSITETGGDHDSATATAVATVGEANREINMTVPPISASEG